MLSRVGTGAGELVSSYNLSSQGIASRDVTFGRGAESDIVLNTDRLPLLISRKHAVLSLAGQKLCKGSTNRTYVNEQRIQPRQSIELHEGSLVSFGGPKLIVRDGQQHSNPFVYKLSQLAAVTSHGNAAQSAPQAIDTGAAAAPQEQAVDLTRTASLEAGPSDIVDLTNSPDLQVCCKVDLLAAVVCMACVSHVPLRRLKAVAYFRPEQIGKVGYNMRL